MKAGAEDVVPKPVTLREIVQRLAHATEPDLSRTPTLREAQWQHIHRVLEDVNGNIARAATILGIERNTLKRWLRDYAPVDTE